MRRSNWPSRIAVLLLIMTLTALSIEASGFLQFAGYAWAVILGISLVLNWDYATKN